MAVGQVFYTPWCDEHGKVIDDGTVSRLGPRDVPLDGRRSEPALVPPERRRHGRRRSRTSRRRSRRSRCRARRRPELLRAVAEGRHRAPEVLPRHAAARSPAFPSTSRAPATPAISATRSGCRPQHAVHVWDALMDGGQALRHQAGRHARARRRAHRGRAAADRRRLLQQQEGDDRVAEVHALRDGAGPPGQPGQGALHRPAGAARGARARARHGRSSGSRSTGTRSSSIYDEARARARTVGATASRVAVPVYRDGRQVGRATSTTWSPMLKQMIALATVDRPHYAEGTALQIEMTVEAVRHRVRATVVKTPFFNPPRKTALPPDSSLRRRHRRPRLPVSAGRCLQAKLRAGS